MIAVLARVVGLSSPINNRAGANKCRDIKGISSGTGTPGRAVIPRAASILCGFAEPWPVADAGSNWLKSPAARIGAVGEGPRRKCHTLHAAVSLQ